MNDTHPFLTHLSRCSACALNILAPCPEGYRLLTVKVMEDELNTQAVSALRADGFALDTVHAPERANHGMAQHEVIE